MRTRTDSVKKKTIFFVSLAGGFLIVALNVALIKGAPIYDQHHKPTSQLEYEGYFHGQYVVDDPSVDDRYIKNPLMSPYCRTGRAVMDLEITPDRFTATTRPTGKDGYETVSSSIIGKEIFYLGNGVFAFYTSDLGFGGIFPGTGFGAQKGTIRISEESVSVKATHLETGMMFFVMPWAEYWPFEASFQKKP